MCIHELWTYPECGCQITHHIPCDDTHVCPCSTRTDSSPSALSEHRDKDSVLPSRSPGSNTHRSINKDYSPRFFPWQSYLNISQESLSLSTSTNDSPSPSPIDYTSASNSNSNTDQDDTSGPDDDYHAYLRRTSKLFSLPLQKTATSSDIDFPHDRSDVTRACSVKHTVHRDFLEPICEDCLMTELGVTARGEQVLNGWEHDADTDIRDGGDDERGDDLGESPRGRPLTRASHTSRQTERDCSPANDHEVVNRRRLIWDSDIKVEITPCRPSVTPTPPPSSSASPTAPPKQEVSPSILKGLAKSPGAKSPTLYPSIFGANGIKRSSVVSSIDLSRRRPWLVKELESFLEKGGDKVDVRDGDVEEESDADAEKAVFDSSVEVKVLETIDEGVLEDSNSRCSAAAVQDEGKSRGTGLARRRFPSMLFSRTPSNSAASPFEDSPRQPSRFSTLTTTTSADADADDEASLHTSSPLLFSRAKTKANTDSPRSPHQNALTSPDITPSRTLRPRSYTKTMRRRGMDIARSSFALRISSQWGSRERESLRSFKDDLMGRGERVRRDGVPREEAVDYRQGRVEAGREKEEKEEAWKEVDDKAKGRGDVWSGDILQSLEQVRVPENTEVEDNGDSAEPPSIKLHRNDVLATPARETDARGSSSGTPPAKNLLTKFSQAQNGGRTWAKSVLGDFRRSLSLDSVRKGAKTSPECHTHETLHRTDTPIAKNGNDVANAGERSGVCNLRAVMAPSIDDLIQSTADAFLRPLSAWTESSTEQPNSTHTVSANEGEIDTHPSLSTSDFPSIESDSWEAHLAHDLAMPRTVKKLVLDSHNRAAVTMPPKGGFGVENDQRASSTDSLTNSLETVPRAIAPNSEHWGVSGVARRESAKRLLSSSTGPSVPVTASSSSSATWTGHGSGSAFEADGWNGERLASIANSSDFDGDDELIGNAWIDANESTEKDADKPNGFVSGLTIRETQLEARSRVTTIDEVLAEDASDDSSQKLSFKSATSAVASFDTTPHVAGTLAPNERGTGPATQSERPRNPTPSSLPTFKFKPRANSPAKKGLTQQPLSTPLCISTPHGGEFASRTSSLSSHPMQTPTRCGMPPSFNFTFTSDAQPPATPASAPPSKSAANHSSSEVDSKSANGTESVNTLTLSDSPTSKFACIWNRYLCEDGCGRVAREEVESCACAQPAFTGNAKGSEGKEMEPRCRSTAPVVRYVDVDASAVDVIDYAEGSSGHVSAQSSQRCRDCESRA